MDTAKLENLLNGYVDGTLSADKRRELEQMLLASAEVRELFWSHVQLHCSIRNCYEARSEQQFVGSANRPSIERLEPPPAPIFISLGPPGSAWHGTVGYVSSGWPVAYLVATVIFGIGLLIGSRIYVSQPVQVAQQSVLPSTFGRGAGGEGSENVTHSRPAVGQITGMVDCQFVEGSGFRVQGSGLPPAGRGAGGEGGSDGLHPSSPVSLGDKFALVSGLVEITYDTGAKVILQGPVTYEVESPAGGFLSLGKLTARVNKRDGGRGPGDGGTPNLQTSKSPNPMPNPQSPIPNPSSLSTIHYPLFTIKTPTATVTDLGTEFGVAVSREGRTELHVLQGTVEAQATTVRGAALPVQRVTEGLAVAIGPKTKGVISVAFAPQSFVRRVRVPMADTPTEFAYIRAVLADRPMGYWPLNESAGARTFVDRSGHGIHGYAMNKVQAGQPGPMSGTRALELDGGGYIDLGYHPEFAMKNDFTVEAWAWIGKVKRHGMIFAVFGVGDHPNGWTLMAGRALPRARSSCSLALVTLRKSISSSLPMMRLKIGGCTMPWSSTARIPLTSISMENIAAQWRWVRPPLSSPRGSRLDAAKKSPGRSTRHGGVVGLPMSRFIPAP